MRARPLAGIRVLDLTRLLPGAMCTLHLADMGADVVKVEDPRRGDYSRHMDFGAGASEAFSAFFECTNRNKRSLKLDLADTRGRAVFMDLARGAQVVVESFRPGVVDRLGVGYAALREVNPRIVYCSISGYGQTGPYREHAGHDLNYCAYAGVTDQAGSAGDPPALINFQIADLAGGALSAAMGILAALFDAERSGAGRHVDVSMADCTLAHAVVPLATLNETGAPPPRGGDVLSGAAACYGVYATADGRHLTLSALEAKFWRRFCEVVGRPDLVPRQYATGEEGARLRAELVALFATRTRDEWSALLAGDDCCVAPVLSMDESLRDPHFRARGMLVEGERRDGGPLTQFAFPIRMSDFAFAVERRAPAHGEHSAEVLRESGYSEERIAALGAEGVI